jgi:hypothetical protein
MMGTITDTLYVTQLREKQQGLRSIKRGEWEGLKGFLKLISKR